VHGHTVPFTILTGTAIERSSIILPAHLAPQFDSCLALGFMKSGTVLLSGILASLIDGHGMRLANIPNQLFEAGIHLQSAQFDFGQLFMPQGYCYGVFREIWPAMVLNPVVRSARKIFITRNPLDALVSLYFSVKFSHLYPEKRTGVFDRNVRAIQDDAATSEIDDYVLSYCWALHGGFHIMRPLLDLSSTKILRYEDYIFDKAQLVSTIADWFRLPVSNERAAEIGAHFDIIPAIDDPYSHIRQVQPGDAQRKLKPETIATLRAVFRDFIRYFGYE
jgi:hypothetical protein